MQLPPFGVSGQTHEAQACTVTRTRPTGRNTLVTAQVRYGQAHSPVDLQFLPPTWWGYSESN